MKLRLLFGTLMLTAMTANAQVATLNENFNNFTVGNTTFPQNGWSAIVAPMTGAFPPAPPRMVVGPTDDPNKFIQSYAGNNDTTPSYLITPQIVTPAGDKSISFTATAASPYTAGSATIQIGVASNPSDMSTFVATGSPITVTAAGTIQNITVPIPASTGTAYLVFKFLPTVAHTAIQIDDVVYNTTSTLAVSDATKSKEDIKFAVNAENTALQFVAKKDPKNVQIYSAGAQKVAEGKLKGQTFDISALQTGVYYINIETAEGSVVKSKFIKK